MRGSAGRAPRPRAGGAAGRPGNPRTPPPRPPLPVHLPLPLPGAACQASSRAQPSRGPRWKQRPIAPRAPQPRGPADRTGGAGPPLSALHKRAWPAGPQRRLELGRRRYLPECWAAGSVGPSQARGFGGRLSSASGSDAGARLLGRGVVEEP